MGWRDRLRRTRRTEPAARLDPARQDFLEQVTAAFDGAPGVTGLRPHRDSFELVVERAGGPVRVSLAEAFSASRTDSEPERAERVRQLVASVSSGAGRRPDASPLAARAPADDPPPQLSWAEASRLLRPALRGVAALGSGGAAGSRPAGRPAALPYLAELLVLDGRSDVGYVDWALLATWGAGVDEALASAWANLVAAPGDVVERQSPDGRRLFEHLPGSGCASARLLQPGWLRGLEERAGTALVAVAPSPDDLWAVPADDDTGLDWLVDTAREAYLAARTPVSPVPCAVAATGEVAPWAVSPDDSLAPRVLAADRLLAITEYTAQEHDLAASDAATGDTVAPIVGVEQPNGGLLSCATWTRGQATLLPECDLLAIVPDAEVPESSILVRSSDAGIALERWTEPAPGLLPARRRTTGFPDAATLDVLRAVGRTT